MAHRVSEEAKTKKAFDDSLPKKACEGNNKRVNQKEETSNEAKLHNNNTKVSALLDVRIKESQKRINEPHEAIAKEAVAHRVSEEAKTKKAFDDSLAKKAWEGNNKRLTKRKKIPMKQSFTIIIPKFQHFLM